MLLRFRSVDSVSTPAAGTVQRPAPAGEATEDGDLVRRSADGEAPALARLYQRHGASVYRYAWLVTGSESLAADVVHETFLALFNRSSGFDAARGSCVAYLCGIARHIALRHVDPRTDSTAEIEDVARDCSGDDGVLPPPPLAAAERAQSLDRLYAAIRQLPAHYRDVLVLVELQELSYAEAAAVAGIELGTVRSRLARARERLRELLVADRASTSDGREQRT
jgi:RNA polymerase sigma-70 factor (ECF subfamily)